MLTVMNLPMQGGSLGAYNKKGVTKARPLAVEGKKPAMDLAS